jgi:hypothetical protein
VPTLLASPWGRHSSQCWQLDHAGHKSVQRNRAIKRVGPATGLEDRRETQGANEQRAEHVPARLNVAREESPPVGQLVAQAPLQVASDRRRRDRALGRRTQLRERGNSAAAGAEPAFRLQTLAAETEVYIGHAARRSETP